MKTLWLVVLLAVAGCEEQRYECVTLDGEKVHVWSPGVSSQVSWVETREGRRIPNARIKECYWAKANG